MSDIEQKLGGEGNGDGGSVEVVRRRERRKRAAPPSYKYIIIL